jgi:16S rRNA (cytosine1402-N4)-methyltransferase
MVKHEFQKYAGKRQEKDTPKELAAILNENAPPSRAKIIKPFPVIPSEDEIQANPRSRSAKLRVLEKLR